jgi:glycosyl hydrolase family 43
VPRPIAIAVAALAAAVGLAGCSPGGGNAGLPRLGPVRAVYPGDFGDPFVLPVSGTATRATEYVLFGTDDPPDHIPTATSTDLVHWTHGPDAVPLPPAWAAPDPDLDHFWAPAAVRIGGSFLLYISVPDQASQRQCIAALRSADPLGPFSDARGSPLVCQPGGGGSIDPSVVAGDGLHLVWKSDGNCCGQPPFLWEQDLAPDGLSLVGRPHELLMADRPWQGGIVENPAMVRSRRGGWWLFYSGNQFDVAAYGTGLANCPSLNGPCRETSSLPFLSASAAGFSPGGLDVFRAVDGRLWAAYAVWNRPSRQGRFYCCRSVVFAPFASTG